MNRPLTIFFVLSFSFLCQCKQNDFPEHPTLFFIANDGNVPIYAADANFIPDRQNKYLVVATHGWIEHSPWPGELAKAIYEKVDPNQWLCSWYDWRKQAKVVNPADAAIYARDTAGPDLAQKIIHLGTDYEHIHLIGHSAGSWAISEAAKILAAKEPHARLHLTFLDAYIPIGWDESQLADINDPNTTIWSDHYFTKDATLRVTETPLSHAHNVDLTKVDPGPNDHEMPRYWYHATVIGKYQTGERYGLSTLYYQYENISYGFGVSFESSPQMWKPVPQLPINNLPVVLERPPLMERLKETLSK
ncbi:MAG: hypothetical protein PHF37_02605 [Phycisphaerae bacterium]|nr:hypothetical protein [Phycisphaerae bacterium]